MVRMLDQADELAILRVYNTTIPKGIGPVELAFVWMSKSLGYENP